MYLFLYNFLVLLPSRLYEEFFLVVCCGNRRSDNRRDSRRIRLDKTRWIWLDSRLCLTLKFPKGILCIPTLPLNIHFGVKWFVFKKYNVHRVFFVEENNIYILSGLVHIRGRHTLWLWDQVYFGIAKECEQMMNTERPLMVSKKWDVMMSMNFGRLDNGFGIEKHERPFSWLSMLQWELLPPRKF